MDVSDRCRPCRHGRRGDISLQCGRRWARGAPRMAHPAPQAGVRQCPHGARGDRLPMVGHALRLVSVQLRIHRMRQQACRHTRAAMCVQQGAAPHSACAPAQERTAACRGGTRKTAGRLAAFVCHCHVRALVQRVGGRHRCGTAWQRPRRAQVHSRGRQGRTAVGDRAQPHRAPATSARRRCRRDGA